MLYPGQKPRCLLKCNPVKRDLPYFAHYSTTHNDPKMQALLAECGFEGYGRYWILCEIIASSPDAILDISSRVIKLTIARSLGLNAEEFEGFIGFLSAPDIKLIKLENCFITTDQLQENFQRVLKKRKRDRTDYNSDGEPLTDSPIPLTEMSFPIAKNIQSKVNKSKVNKSSGGNENAQKPPPFFLDIKNKIACHGFFFDDTEIENLIQKTDPAWFEGHGFIDFIAETFRGGGYADKPKRDQHKIFRKLLLDAQNLREEYPRWREGQIKADAERARKKAEAEKPEACPVCGIVFMPGYLSCPAGHGRFVFDEAALEYRFIESRNTGDLAKEFARHMATRNAAS